MLKPIIRMHHLILPLLFLIVYFYSVQSVDLNHMIRKHRDDPVVPDDYWLKQQLRTHMTSANAAANSDAAPKRIVIPPGLRPAARAIRLPPGLNLRPAVSIGSAPAPFSVQSTSRPQIRQTSVVTDPPAKELLTTTTTEAPASSSTTEIVFTPRIPEVPVDLQPAVNSRRIPVAANGPSLATVKIPVVGARGGLQRPQAGRAFTFAVSNTLENRERKNGGRAGKSNSGTVKSVVQSLVKNVTLEDVPSADNSSSKPKINRIVTTAEEVTENEHVDISFGPASAKNKRQVGFGSILGLKQRFPVGSQSDADNLSAPYASDDHENSSVIDSNPVNGQADDAAPHAEPH